MILSTEPRRDIDMRRWFQEGVQMVLDGTVNTSEMVTHIYPLERVQEAFEGLGAVHVVKPGRVEQEEGEEEGEEGEEEDLNVVLFAGRGAASVTVQQLRAARLPRAK